MEEIAVAVVKFIATNPEARSVIEGIASKIFFDFMARRKASADFAAKQDAIFEQMATATTDEEKENAHKALQALMAS